MFGTLINAIAVIIGSIIGLIIRFKIPKKIDGNDYNIRIIDNRELVVEYIDYEHVLFLPENVMGNIDKGLNEIKKSILFFYSCFSHFFPLIKVRVFDAFLRLIILSQ